MVHEQNPDVEPRNAIVNKRSCVVMSVVTRYVRQVTEKYFRKMLY